MRTMSLAVLLTLLAAATAVGGDDPEPPINRQSLLLELSLPRVGLPTGKVKPLTPDLKGTDLKTYADRAKADSPVRKAVRTAQVALWACSHETAPVPLQTDVVAARKKWKLDPQALRLRYAIPNGKAGEARLKNEAFETTKQLSRLVGHLEDALEGLSEVEDSASKEGPRWQAHVALLRLWLLLRIVALEEHQSALGMMRKELPFYDPGKHTGWQLAPDERLIDSVSKKHAGRARQLSDGIAKAHRNTAWEKLAQEAIKSKLSARWDAVK